MSTTTTSTAAGRRSATYWAMREPALDDPESYADPRLSCDLIMKGGITSGVVYPQAACRLATRYRLRRLGGASAGAIAAALTAAAEYHRRHPPARAAAGPAGFVRLAAIPTDLGTDLGALFQPVRATRPAHSILMTAAAPGRGKVARALATVVRLVAAAPLVFALLLVLLLVPLGIWVLTRPAGQPAVSWPLLWSGLALLPGALVLALLATTAWVLWRADVALQGNGFGLSNGHTTDGRDNTPPLTDWMTTTLDQTAGLQDGPLCFGHLWGATAVATYGRLRRRQDAGERLTSQDWREFQPDIDLKVMTTNLTLRKPYEFPFNQDQFFYCRRCWNAYFPDVVMKHLEEHAGQPTPHRTLTSDSGVQQVRMTCPRHPDVVVRPLPAAAQLPVVVAARISLSFPGLISAVPLLCIDFSRGPGHRGLIVCWFSDGGIASNFPIHFFDAPWPGRPTFGLDLEPLHPDFPDQLVWRPQKTLSGVFPRSHQLASMPGFLTAVVRTMQNWVDSSQVSMPGFRDRVTELRTRPGEGGLNLRMSDPMIKDLAERGSDAGLEFADFDFSLHRWIRYRSVMNALSESLDLMNARWPHAEGDDDEGYRELITRYAGAPGDYRLDAVDARADARATARLIALARRWEKAGYPATALRVPQPQARLRAMPPL